MNRSAPLQRRTPLRSNTGLKARTQLRRNTKLRPKGHSETATIKDDIQALLRAIVIKRDGGCVLRHYAEAGACGGYTRGGELILQAEHLVTRGNSISFGDLRNIVCLCRHHHGHFKPEHSRLYWELIERHIGPERWAWLKAVEADRRPHRMTLYDWQKIATYLRAKFNAMA